MRPILIVLAGCGRIGFGAVSVDGDANDSDGSIADGPSHLIHRYRFANSYADDLGGPDMVPHGGSFVAGGYQFGPSQGVSVDGALPSDVYTVDLRVTFVDTANWRKLIDFKNLVPDDGLYIYDGALQVVIVPMVDFLTGALTFADNVPMRIALTRDASDHVVGYAMRAIVAAERAGVPDVPSAPASTFAYDDSTRVLGLTGATAAFFMDDTSTTTEASAGVVREISIYDVALAGTEIAALPP